MKNHGAQCGYCTPGMVVSLYAMFNSYSELGSGRHCDGKAGGKGSGSTCKIGQRDIRDALTGNLCRCTGYEPIIRAGLDVDFSKVLPLSRLYVPDNMLEAIGSHQNIPIAIEADGRKYFNPQTVDQACEFKSANPGCVIVQGGTDVCVQGNKRGVAPEAVMSLSNLKGLRELKVENNVLIVGGKVTLSQVERYVKDLIPEFYEMLGLFGSPQIKNAGTLAGNIVNASPIAGVPFLFFS